jgi:hypothetical protein
MRWDLIRHSLHSSCGCRAWPQYAFTYAESPHSHPVTPVEGHEIARKPEKQPHLLYGPVVPTVPQFHCSPEVRFLRLITDANKLIRSES